MATTFKKYQFPGLANPVYLPSWIQVEIKIISASVWGWTAGTKASGQTRTTYHDTGNPSSNANSEYNWAAGGGRGQLGSPGSYNGIFDSTKLIITQRFDEMVGHAGVSSGNYGSYAFEEAYGGAGNSHAGAMQVGMWVHAAIIVAKGWDARTALVQHNYWSGKNCPAQIRARGEWNTVVNTVADRAAEIRAYIAGGTPPPQYASPARIAALDAAAKQALTPYKIDLKDHATQPTIAYYAPQRVRTIRATARRQYSEGGGIVGPELEAGEEFDSQWLLTSGGRYPDTLYTPWATRIRAADTAGVE